MAFFPYGSASGKYIVKFAKNTLSKLEDYQFSKFPEIISGKTTNDFTNIYNTNK